MKTSNSYQKQYAEILYNLMNHPHKQRPSRIGATRSRFVEVMRVDLEKEFPLMDIKKIQFTNILYELLWFIHGDTCIKYLVDNGCNIWTDDAFRYYNEKYVPQGAPKLSKEEFIEKAKTNEKFGLHGAGLINPPPHEKYLWYCYGDLDRVYGKQWREFNGRTDQLKNCVETLKKNPDDRRMIVSAHNPTDIEDNNVGLPSCHNMFQFYTIPLTLDERRDVLHYSGKFTDIYNDTEESLDALDVPKFYVNVWFNIRSNDFFLGNCYNVASYALLLEIVGNIVNMIPKEVVCNAVDCHLYEAHIPAAQEWLKRYSTLVETNDNMITSGGWGSPYQDIAWCKAKLKINKKINSIDEVTADDIHLLDYDPQSYIKAPLLT